MDFLKTLSVHLKSITDKDYDNFISTVLLDEITLVMPNGTFINDGEEFSDMHKEWFAETDWQLQYQLLKTSEVSDMAYALVDVSYSDVDQKGNPVAMKYYLSLTFRKKNENWLLVHDQNTIHK